MDTSTKFSASQKGFAPILVLVGILVIGVLVGGTYYSGLIKLPSFNQTPSVIITPSPKNIATPVPSSINSTADWKTYTNTKYGYSVKYPSSIEMVINDKVGENDISFIPKSYLIPGTYESPQLKLMVYEVDQQEANFMRSPNGTKLPKNFSDETLNEGGQTIFFMIGSDKELNASCGTRGDKAVLDICNQIIEALQLP